MAAAKTNTKTKSGGKSKSRKKTSASPSPVRREVGGFVCLLFALLTLLGCFGVDAILIGWVKTLAMGLFGFGFYLLPPFFIVAGFVLLTHRGRPVALRTTCALLSPVIIGILGHLFTCKLDFNWGLEMFARLWESGGAGISGGALSGLLAESFSAVISSVGAIIVFIMALIFTVLGSFNMTVMSIYEAVKNRPRPEYEQVAEEVDTAAVLVEKVTEKRAETAARRSQSATRRAASIDIPVDDPIYPPVQEKKADKKKLYDNTPRVKTPDEHMLELEGLAKAAASAPSAQSVRAAAPEPLAAPVPEPIPVSVPIPAPAVVPVPAPAPVPTPAPTPAPQSALETAAAPEKPTAEDTRKAAAEVASEIDSAKNDAPAYTFPPVSLLEGPKSGMVDGTDEMRTNAARLSETLKSFGIEASITDVIRGPSVTRYELELDKGVKLSRLTNLSDDIALALGASGVRIAAIPNKISIVGVEVPNQLVSTVHIREVIDSKEFKQARSKVSFAVGTDISGAHIVGDIAKLPHMLIAGTTGSGKSVCINSIIISLLYKSTPDEVRLIMIDPKMIELGVYNSIPHLLIPVVTDPKKAAGALQWAVTEMLRRYKHLAELGVRDIDAYNKAVENDPDRQKMPQIVIVIDELADLMMVAAKEVEDSICRIAQMARAAGMHLLIATQRPSSDVITGIMKANIPSRIAFAVASQLESRIILDATGAEKLVGKGDMLFNPLGAGKPKRVQGCFISDSEVESVVDFIKKTAVADYSEDIIQHIEKTAEEKKDSKSADPLEEKKNDYDELLPAAVEVVLETGQASVSMLQRRLKLGYSRAARIVDEMEEQGIVGPFEGSKPRQLLITRAQWNERKLGGEPSEIQSAAEDMALAAEMSEQVESEAPFDED